MANYSCVAEASACESQGWGAESADSPPELADLGIISMEAAIEAAQILNNKVLPERLAIKRFLDMARRSYAIFVPPTSMPSYSAMMSDNGGGAAQEAKGAIADDPVVLALLQTSAEDISVPDGMMRLWKFCVEVHRQSMIEDMVLDHALDHSSVLDEAWV